MTNPDQIHRSMILAFEPEFFYAIAISEFILAIAFLFAIYKVILVNLIPMITKCFPELIEPMNELVKAVFTLRFEGTRF